MALPRIDPYPLPTAAELPPARVDWVPEPHRAVLLVHDMQRYFLQPFAASAELVAAVVAVRRWCREAGVPVVHTAQPSRPSSAERGLLRDFWGDGLRAVDPALADLVAELTPDPGEPIVTKWRYSAFAHTSFEEVFAGTGRDQLLITGVYAHIGCLATALDAFQRDIQPFLVADALGDFSRSHHDDALTSATRSCGVALTAADLRARLGVPAEVSR